MRVTLAFLALGAMAALQTSAQTPSRVAEANALFAEAQAALPDRDEMHALLDRAIAADPRFAPAYALKAEHYAQAIAAAAARAEDPAPARELHALAVANAERALALDPSLDNAYAALGLAHRQLWYWPEALAAYAEAYARRPADATAMSNWIWLSSFARRHEEAITVAARAAALYPASANAHRDLGLAHAYAGNLQPASAALRACIARDPRVTICHIYLAFMQIRLGNPAVAVVELQTAEELFGASPTPATLSSVAHGYFRAGRPDDAARLVARVQQLAARGVVGAGSWPLAHLAVADSQRAYEWLERAVAKIERHEADEGFFNLMIVKANVAANPVLEEARFRALRDRIGAVE
jgi:serine/threonine-protein kinase